jgi:hypothetical protein
MQSLLISKSHYKTNTPHLKKTSVPIIQFLITISILLFFNRTSFKTKKNACKLFKLTLSAACNTFPNYARFNISIRYAANYLQHFFFKTYFSFRINLTPHQCRNCRLNYIEIIALRNSQKNIIKFVILF